MTTNANIPFSLHKHFILMKSRILLLGTTRYYFSVIFLLPLVLALFNTNWFSIQSLTAYIGFTVFSAIGGCILFSIHSLKNNIDLFYIPKHLLIFSIFVLTIIVHGVLNRNFTYVHFYWINCLIWLLGLCLIQSTYFTKVKENNTIQNNLHQRWLIFIFSGIVLLSFFESVVVLLQAVGLLDSKNKNFSITGTWVNPNVTALFLAFSISSINYLINRYNKKYLKSLYLLLLLVLISILILQSRTAYIISILLLLDRFSFLQKCLKNRIAVILMALLFTFFVFLLAFNFKNSSTEGRLNIWKNSLYLISNEPLSGHGFGSFEKVYNYFIIKDNYKINIERNDHVDMPYNDFIELGVEGGIFFIVLWVLYLISLFVYSLRNKNAFLTIPLILSFIILQLTNFGFQAIPVFALFLLYTILSKNINYVPSLDVPFFKFSSSKIFSRYLLYILTTTSLLLFIKQVNYAFNLYALRSVVFNKKGLNKINGFLELGNKMNGFYHYHELLGNEYMKDQKYRYALNQYLLAIRNCSYPDILFKCAISYSMLNQIDSSEYYFKIVTKMQPHKFIPQFALLHLYEKNGNAQRKLEQAKLICNMPIKVESRRVYDIKTYANNILINHNSIISTIK